MKLIVGLGNPGRKYEKSRHNLGCNVIRALAKELKSPFKKKLSLESLITETEIYGKPVLLALPQTYMNLSGRAIRSIIKRKNISLAELIVVCDDISLNFGVLRLRSRGSSGGHRGLASIIKELGTTEFARLRLGIKGDFLNKTTNIAEYVLSGFNKAEKAHLASLISKTLECLKTWAREGITEAMNKFN